MATSATSNRSSSVPFRTHAHAEAVESRERREAEPSAATDVDDDDDDAEFRGHEGLEHDLFATRFYGGAFTADDQVSYESLDVFNTSASTSDKAFSTTMDSSAILWSQIGGAGLQICKDRCLNVTEENGGTDSAKPCLGVYLWQEFRLNGAAKLSCLGLSALGVDAGRDETVIIAHIGGGAGLRLAAFTRLDGFCMCVCSKRHRRRPVRCGGNWHV